MLRSCLSEQCFMVYILSPLDRADCSKGGQLTQRQPVQRLATDMTQDENLTNSYSLEEKKKKANGYKHRKWCSALLMIVKMHIKTKQRHNFFIHWII